MSQFDITCTSTLRPELLATTLKSFTNNLFRTRIRESRFIINIDMVGCNPEEQDSKLRDVKDIIYSYPFEDVIPRICNDPHFGKAFHWCFSRVRNPLVFHLEEDWEIVRPMNFAKMMELMERNGDLVHLRLSAFRSEEQTCKNWNKFLQWNGQFFEVAEEDRGVIGWCGHPSLNKTWFMKKMLAHMDPEINPEKQIKAKRTASPVNMVINNRRYGSFQEQNAPASICDTGRRWMIEHGYHKLGNKAWFVNWEKGE